MDVVTFTGKGTQLVGYLYRTHDLANQNPDLWDVPKFIPFDDKFYDEKRATYFGEIGFEFARKELAKLSQARLAKKGIERYLIKNYLRKITIFLPMYKPDQEGLATVEEVEFYSSKAPDAYKSDGNYFRLNLTADEDEHTTAFYTLSGKYQP